MRIPPTASFFPLLTFYAHRFLWLGPAFTTQQLCWEIGFPATNLPLYISGQQREILLNYPELMYYRDIVFMFKFMMTPTSSALPPIKIWSRMFSPSFPAIARVSGLCMQGNIPM